MALKVPGRVGSRWHIDPHPAFLPAGMQVQVGYALDLPLAWRNTTGRRCSAHDLMVFQTFPLYINNLFGLEHQLHQEHLRRACQPQAGGVSEDKHARLA
jgi:hypothetical protein